MGLFDDDFYSTKVSRRGLAGWLDAVQSKLPLIGVAIVSSIVGALMAMVFFKAFGGGAQDLPASGMIEPSGMAMDAYNFEERIVAAAAKMMPVVVSVINKQEGLEPGIPLERRLGSGVIFAKENNDAYIFTNNHVIEGSDEIEVVMTDGAKRIAELVGRDPISDLAVLRIDAKGITSVAEFGDSDKLRVGQTVIAIGNPLGLGYSQTFTRGIVSSMNRTVPVSLNQDGIYDWEQEVIQTDAAINEGNSGGALIDLNGYVVGINSMKVADTGVEGLGFAIPINSAIPTLRSLVEHGKVLRPYIGVYTLDLEMYLTREEGERTDLRLPDDVKEGVVVLEAVGPALEGGLRANDVIVKLDDQPIASTLQLRKYLYGKKAIGDELKVTFYRGGELHTTIVMLEEMRE
jgi:serine protease Do